MDEKVTKPTIETVLERMVGMEERLNQRMDAVEVRLNQRIDGMEKGLGVRLDRIESVVHTTRGEMLELRADFRELNIKL